MVSLSSWSVPRSRREEPPYFTKSQVITVLEQVGTLLQLVASLSWMASVFVYGSYGLGDYLQLIAASAWTLSNIFSLLRS